MNIVTADALLTKLNSMINQYGEVTVWTIAARYAVAVKNDIVKNDGKNRAEIESEYMVGEGYDEDIVFDVAAWVALATNPCTWTRNDIE